MTAPADHPADHPAGRRAAARAPGPRPYASRLFACGALAALAAGSLPALHRAALPAWAAAFALGAGEGGLIVTAHGAGALLALAAGVAGLPVMSMGTGLALTALGASLLALGWGWPPALAGAFVAGAGFGTLLGVVDRRFLLEFGARGPGVMALGKAVFGAGAVLAPLLMAAAGGRPEVAFWAVAALAALALPLVTPEPSRGGAERAARPRPGPLRARTGPLAFILLASLIEALLVGGGALMFARGGMEADGIARLVAAFFAASLMARVALWRVAALVAPGRLFLWGMGGMAACAGLAAAAPGAGLAPLAFAASGAFAGVTFPSFYVWAMGRLGTGPEPGGEPRLGPAVAAAAVLGTALGGAALRPALLLWGERGALAAVAVAAALLAGAFAALARREAPRPREAAP